MRWERSVLVTRILSAEPAGRAVAGERRRSMTLHHVALQAVARRALLGTLLFGAASVAWACGAGAGDPQPGARFPSQKIEFADPISGQKVWRLTTDGAAHGVLHSLRDATSGESQQWSPDATRLCYTKIGHPGKPDGYYVANVVTGIETYMGPSGSLRFGACEFSKTSDELYMVHTSSSPRATELRAVGLSDHTCRVVRHFADTANPIGAMAQNADGSYIALNLGTSPGNVSYGEAAYTSEYVVVDPNGAFHPRWTFDGVPDEQEAGDHPYWHPTDPKVLRAVRDGQNAVWNLDTLETYVIPTFGRGSGSPPRSHACWSPDGTQFFLMSGHPDCHPHDGGLGDKARVVLDRNGRIFLRRIEDFSTVDFTQYPRWRPDSEDDGEILALYYGRNQSHFAHPHLQFSPDARYLVAVSDLAATDRGTPPGGVDADPMSTDIFIVVMAEASSGARPLPPRALAVTHP